jgi:hypothetical protein
MVSAEIEPLSVLSNDRLLFLHLGISELATKYKRNIAKHFRMYGLYNVTKNFQNFPLKVLIRQIFHKLSFWKLEEKGPLVLS